MAKGGPGVVIVESGGLPVTQVTGGGNASPFTVVTGNGFPVTLVDSLGIAVALYNLDGTEYSGFSLTAPIAAWFSGPDVAQALFTIQLPPGTVSGMKVKGESSLDNFSTVLETVITAINPTDLGDGEVEGFAFSPFADGLTYVRFWITNSSESVISEVSNTISETIAAVRGDFFPDRYFPNRYFAERYFG